MEKGELYVAKRDVEVGLSFVIVMSEGTTVRLEDTSLTLVGIVTPPEALFTEEHSQYFGMDRREFEDAFVRLVNE